jgi:transcriptional regulator with XRE-family HTH domain
MPVKLLSSVNLQSGVSHANLCGMTEELPWEYGQMLTSAIEHSGMSRRKVASLAGLSTPTITNLETGTRPAGSGTRVPNKNPELETVVRIAMVLKMQLRRSLEAAGLGDKIPDNMTDEELEVHFMPAIDAMLDDLPDEVLLAAFARRMEKRRQTET